MRSASLAFIASLLFSLGFTANAHSRSADKDDESGEDAPAKAEGADVRVSGKEGEKELDPGEIDRAKQAEIANSPVELPGKTYYFVGLRYRGMLIPKFMMN